MPVVPCFRPSPAAAFGLAVLTATSVRAAPDPQGAAAVFREATAICTRDNGALWGRSLCGPMLLVDPDDRVAVANRADPDGALKPSGALFTGRLPEAVLISNTPIEWSGLRWTELIWPLHSKGDSGVRPAGWMDVELAHELFHRIQTALGLARDEAPNQHLDTFDGRYLLQLEWRALAKALEARTPDARKAAVSDAMLFRGERYRLFPTAAAEEGALEIEEGVAEYTGVKLGLTTPEARVGYAVYDLSAFVAAPSFVRSFAYATGPAYGLLLDRADPDWRHKLNADARLYRMLSTAMRLLSPDFAALKTREAAYDPGGDLRAAETKRDHDRQARLAALKARLVDGPVLTIPLKHVNYQFNPQTLVPLPPYGTVYPTARLSDAWGVLEVESGGVLMDKAMTAATVPAAGIDPSHLMGDGWRLMLNKGWIVAPGARPGDVSVEESAPAGK